MFCRRILMIIVAVTVVVLPGLPAEAQIEQVTLRVDGLACPFCAYGLEKKLKALEGYKSFEALINEGKVIVGWREDKPLDLGAIEDAVKKAGFTLRGVRGSFVGTVTKGSYVLVLPKPVKQRFYLYEPEAIKGVHDKDKHKHEGTAQAMTDKCRQRLDQVIAEKRTVRIVGPVHEHEDEESPPAIGIEGLETIEPATNHPVGQ